MPIHVRAQEGDYADACLLPGDPLRAKYIAETYFDEPVQRNAERGMLGYTGTWEGRPISVQATGMGCPSPSVTKKYPRSALGREYIGKFENGKFSFAIRETITKITKAVSGVCQISRIHGSCRKNALVERPFIVWTLQRFPGVQHNLRP